MRRAARRACRASLTPPAAQKTLWMPVEVRVGPGLLSQTNYTLLLSDTLPNVIGACGAHACFDAARRM